ncbi:MAG: phosphate acetyltransferase [Bacteroidota bacterium]
MANSIYITSSEARCGKSLICLGLVELILRKTRKVGIFRPVIRGTKQGERDKNIDLILNHFNLDIPYEDTYAYHSKDIQALISDGKIDQALDHIITKYKALQAKCDFVLCEGTDFQAESSSFEFNINVEFAKNLGCPVLIVGRADQGRTVEDIVYPVDLAIESYLEKDCEVIGTVINMADPAMLDEIGEEIKRKLPLNGHIYSVIPQNEILKNPTVKEVVEHLGAEVLYGEEFLSRQVFKNSIAAMQMQNYLPLMQEKCMVITPGDRGDIILSVLQANESQNYPSISAILLTTDEKPQDSVRKLLDGLEHTIPILSVTSNTFDTATKLADIHSIITADNHAKIAAGLETFETYVDISKLEEKITSVVNHGMTPKMFQYLLKEKARVDKKHIVLPEGNDERIIRAAGILVDQGIVDLTVLGQEEEILSMISKSGLKVDVDKLNITTPANHPKYESYAQKYYELRKHKGVNMDIAKDTLLDVSYFGTMMVQEGDADGMVSGAVHTTQHTVRPALQLIKTKPGFSVVSSVFFMCLEDRVLVYGDCAINPNPNAEQLAEIAISSADTAIAFEVDPKMALLSYSSGSSGKGADVEKVSTAVQIVKENRSDLKVEGPIQYDAAVDAKVGAQKMPGSLVAGQANVLIFPDLNTGNNTYKAVQRETGAIAIGPVLQGLNKPVNDLSRGCTVVDIVNTVTITAIQAQQMK